MILMVEGLRRMVRDIPDSVPSAEPAAPAAEAAQAPAPAPAPTQDMLAAPAQSMLMIRDDPAADPFVSIATGDLDDLLALEDMGANPAWPPGISVQGARDELHRRTNRRYRFDGRGRDRMPTWREDHRAKCARLDRQGPDRYGS